MANERIVAGFAIGEDFRLCRSVTGQRGLDHGIARQLRLLLISSAGSVGEDFLLG